jgi:hypothetical protein
MSEKSHTGGISVVTGAVVLNSPTVMFQHRKNIRKCKDYSDKNERLKFQRVSYLEFAFDHEGDIGEEISQSFCHLISPTLLLLPLPGPIHHLSSLR